MRGILRGRTMKTRITKRVLSLTAALCMLISFAVLPSNRLQTVEKVKAAEGDSAMGTRQRSGLIWLI